MATRTRRRPLARWQTVVDNDWSLGFFRDMPRTAIPAGGAYDLLDMYTHRPGMVYKRGGTTYAGPATGGGSKIIACIYAVFPSVGNKLLALADNFHLYTVSTSTTDVGTISGTFSGMVDNPTLYVGGLHNFVVLPDFGGGTVPWYYDGSAVPQQFQGGQIDASATYALTITGTPTGGSFKLGVYAQPDPKVGGPASGLEFAAQYMTAAIAYNATAADVATAINTAISNAATFTATGGGLPGTPVTITVPYGWSLSYVPSGLSQVSLTGGSTPNGTIGVADGGTIPNVPKGRFACVHLQRLLLANSYEQQNRLWFGPLINPTSAAWDMANAYIDMDNTISGLASLGSQLLVFSTHGFWRIGGDSPPPDTNMFIEPISEEGCTDARSIVDFAGSCIYANPRGVWVTSGVKPESLMTGKIESYWRSLFSSYTPAADAWTISAGILSSRFLFVTVLNSTTQVATLCCDLRTGAWGRMSNMPHKQYTTAYNADDELYACSSDEARVYKLAGTLLPTSSNKNDADGTAVTCTFEPRALGFDTTLKAYGDAWVDLDMRDAASDNPTMAVTVAAGVEASSFSSAPESPLSETTDMARKRFSLRKDSESVNVKLVQSNASSKTEVYGVRWEERSYQPDSEGQ